MTFRNTCLAIIASTLLVFAASLPAASRILPEDASRIMLANQVKAGMQGYGLTVFKGDKIEQFPVKVLGTLPNTNSGRPLFLVRIGGPVQSARQLNIAQGMSGSPIYINGKVIGAIAYAGGFAKEPLGLVTPIEDMLEAWDPALEQRKPGDGEITPLPSPLKLGNSTITAIGIGRQTSGSSPTTAWFQPLMSPVMVSGLSQRALAAVGDKLGNLGVNIKSGAGAMPSYSGVFKPGSAIGFSLATGDMDMTGIGTVTYVRGKDILAFGHPFLMLGPIELPMTTAWVHDVFPSYEISYKLASPGKIVGSSLHDRMFGISGALGKKADMLPISVKVKGSGSATPVSFNCQVFRHPLYTPIITQIAVMESIARFRPYPGECMAKVTLNVSADEVGTVRRSNLVFNPADITADAMQDLAILLSILSDNRFHPVKVNKINLDIEIFQTRQTMDIEKISIPKLIYEPGETIDIQVTSRPWKKEPVTNTISVKVPENAMDGRTMLAVFGGGMSGMVAPEAGPTASASILPGYEDIREATSVQQMVRRYADLNTNNQMVARLLLPSGSITIDGERLKGLLPALENAIQSPKSSSTRILRDDVRSALDTSFVVAGLQALPVTIQRRSWSEKATPTPSLPGAIVTPADDAKPPVAAPSPVSETVDIETALSAVSTPVPSDEEVTEQEESIDEEVVSEDEETPADENSEATEESEDGTESATEKSKDDKPAVKLENVGRTTQRWLQTTAEDFLKGQAKGLAVSSRGTLVAGHTFTKIAETGEPYVWSIAAAPGGGVYVGTGSGGKVLKITDDGKTETLFQTDGSQVTSLVVTSDNVLWAGVSPSGSIYRYRNGKAEIATTLTAKHPGSLVTGEPGIIYAAAGDSGKVWKLTAGETVSVTVYADTQQACIQTLAFGADGKLYAGTAYKAGVWRLSSGRAESLHVGAEEYFNSLAINKNGIVWASAGPRGKVYKIQDGKAAVAVVDKLSSSSAPLVMLSDDTILTVDSDTLIRINADDSRFTQKTETFADVFALLSTGDGVYASTTNPGNLWKISSAKNGEFISAIRDAERSSVWGKSDYSTPGDGKFVEFAFRTGNTPDPQNGWTGWRTIAPGNNLNVSGPRYLQYRIKTNAPTPIDDVSFWYMAANRQPTVRFSKPPAGLYWSGKQTLQWTGSDPDSDKLTYDLYYSSDNAATWKPLDANLGKLSQKSGDKEKDSDVKPKEDKTTEESAAKPPPIPDQSVIDDLKKKIAENPNVPEAIKKQIMASQPILVRPTSKSDNVGEESAKSDKSEPETTSATSYSWDTKKVDDGDYFVKIRASDRLANGLDALTAEEVAGPIHIVNKKPDVWILRAVDEVTSVSGSGNGKVYQLSGFASSEGGAPIQKVQFRVDGKGEWANAQAADGLFDGSNELFTAALFKLKPGKHEIEVRVEDLAGNTVSGEREFEIK